MADDGEQVMQDDLGSQDGKGDSRSDGNLFYINLDTFPLFFGRILRSDGVKERVFCILFQVPVATRVTVTTKSSRRSL